MLFQRLGHHIDIHLAIAEDDRVGASLALGLDQRPQNGALFGERFVFARGRELDQFLLNRQRSRGLARDFDLYRIRQESIGDPLNFRGHCGRIEERLPGKRGQAENALDIGDKAHVEHPIGLIHHHDLHAGQQQFAALVVIQKASGGGDQHINATVDQLVLFAKRHATDQQGFGQLGVFGISFKVFRHLRCQFARWAQHETARHPGLGAALAQQRDHRQHEAGGLAGAGLGDAQHVFASQRMRDGLGLDRGGGFVAGFRHGFEHAGVQREI